jgi:hypothetical protein
VVIFSGLVVGATVAGHLNNNIQYKCSILNNVNLLQLQQITTTAYEKPVSDWFTAFRHGLIYNKTRKVDLQTTDTLNMVRLYK